jgi:hypothetical protein
MMHIIISTHMSSHGRLSSSWAASLRPFFPGGSHRGHGRAEAVLRDTQRCCCGCGQHAEAAVVGTCQKFERISYDYDVGIVKLAAWVYCSWHFLRPSWKMWHILVTAVTAVCKVRAVAASQGPWKRAKRRVEGAPRLGDKPCWWWTSVAWVSKPKQYILIFFIPHSLVAVFFQKMMVDRVILLIRLSLLGCASHLFSKTYAIYRPYIRRIHAYTSHMDAAPVVAEVRPVRLRSSSP